MLIINCHKIVVAFIV